VLNKQMSVEQNLAAVRTLKELELNVSYGFMLFDPSSTFASVRENLIFLKNVTGDGRAAAVFSRMLPYGGTPIREALKKEGRLRGDLTRPDYVFHDLRLNEFYDMLMPTVRPWIYRQGLTYQLDYAWDEFTTVTRLAPGVQGAEGYHTALQSLTKEANASLFRHVEACLDGFERGDRSPLVVGPGRAYCEAGIERLVGLRNDFIARNVTHLVDVMSADCKSGPVLIPQMH
jgi:anaerobic magnesium-protoporphyrin IX monomethyl ester cyclase